MKKPYWLNKKIHLGSCNTMKNNLREHALHTVCEESLCPNMSECFSSGVATFMILGNVCNRQCSFCAVNNGKQEAIDYNEPGMVAEAVRNLNLDYVVVTSPCRDDLEDGGAKIFVDTVTEIKKLKPSRKVEILIPDFLGNNSAIEKVANSSADVISHNIETVPSLYKKVRSKAEYLRSLKVLKLIKDFNKNVFTKSGIMLGLGEAGGEVINVFGDLRNVGCDFLTIGQYLAPSLKHYPVKEYVSPEKFLYLEKEAYNLGFLKVKSSPYVRSSYLAHDFLKSPASK